MSPRCVEVDGVIFRVTDDFNEERDLEDLKLLAKVMRETVASTPPPNRHNLIGAK